MITGVHPSDLNPYSNVKDSTINPLLNGNGWRPHPLTNLHSGNVSHPSLVPPSGTTHHHQFYSNPYVYDAATAVALVGYSPYASSYSPHMDLAGRRKNATRETTATLKAWLYEHRKNPYPTKSEKVYLAIMTKMTLTQVSTWFANARRRLKKENKMTWSPRNRTNEDDDDEDENDRERRDDPNECRTDHSDLDDDEDDDEQSQCESSSIPPPPPSLPPSSSTTSTSTISTTNSTQIQQRNSFLSNFHFMSNPLTILHQQTIIPSTQFNSDENCRKRKFDQMEKPIEEKKKSSAIWSLADMAEKNPKEKTISSTTIIPLTKQRLSSSSASSTRSTPSHSPRSPQEKSDEKDVETPNSSSSSSSPLKRKRRTSGAFQPLK